MKKHKFPKVNFIGNKEKITDWIISKIPKEVKTVLDLFSGSGSVSYSFKKNNLKTISNDGLFCNFVISKAIVENNNEKLDFSEIEEFLDVLPDKNILERINFLRNNIYFDYEVEELAKLITISKNFSGNKYYIFLSLIRRSMIRKIPYSRMNIKWSEIIKLRNEEYSYKKYGRKRHYHNISFLEHIKQNINNYNNSIFESKKTCSSHNKDAIEFIKDLNEKVDLIYIDPPYPFTMNKYEEFYGKIDQVFGKQSNIKNNFCSSETFEETFENLIKLSKEKTKYLMISLNNKILKKNNFIDLLKKYSTIKIFKKNFSYKVTNKKNKNNNQEILFLCKLF